MAHVTADRVRDTSTSTSTGNFTVTGTAPTGFRTLSAVLSVSDTFYYAIQSQTDGSWEVGLGTYSSANTFARTTVLSSSNAGSAVNFSAGTKDVFLTLAAARTIQSDASGSVGTIQFAAGTVSAPGITTVGDTNTGIFFPAADSIALVTAGAEDFRIGPSGQFGVGGANYGTSGQVLTSGGSSSAPSWATPATSVINTQTFDTTPSAPGWTKPSGYSANSRVLIQAWGGGGSGARQSTAGSCSGGGGGGYNERWLSLSQMGATETVTIGAGGASRTGSNQAGDQGGNTTVGSLITAYGGAGGTLTNGGGGGGGQLSAGSSVSPGRPFVATGNGTEEVQGGGSVSTLGAQNRNAALFHGGGGGYGTTAITSGSSSVWGGGGGGGGNATSLPGTSSFGGNGGAGGATGTAGTQPAGGGGGGTTTSGAGAAGRVIITVFPA
jgi:hypothetical protein